VSLRIGVAVSNQPSEIEELIKLADRQMYLSKEGGKNQANFDVVEGL
jgi:GGDEF domain-containing protein